MKYTKTKTKKLLSNLSICLFALALAGCSTTTRYVSRYSGKALSTTSLNQTDTKNRGEDMTKSTSDTSTSEVITQESERDVTKSDSANEEMQSAISTNQQPNNPAETEDDSKLLQELKDHCHNTQKLLKDAKKILNETEGIRQKPNGSMELKRAVEARDTKWATFSDSLQKAQEADKTLQPLASKATGKHAADIKKLATEAQTNLTSVNTNDKKIKELIKGAKAAMPKTIKK